MKITHFEIHFGDLTPIAQHYLCRKFQTTKEEESRKSIPLAIMEREIKEEECKCK